MILIQKFLNIYSFPIYNFHGLELQNTTFINYLSSKVAWLAQQQKKLSPLSFILYLHLSHLKKIFYVAVASSSPKSHTKESEDSFITSSPLGSFSKRKKQRIFETITQEIGSFWRDLARNLKIRERDIDDIDIQNKTLAVKATKLMEKYDSIADPQRWFFILCDALERTRRKDLVRSIQDIMAMNI